VGTAASRCFIDVRLCVHTSRSSLATATEASDLPYIPGRKPQRVKREPKQLSELNVGFVGWGAMAQAVSLGMLRSGLTDPSRMAAFDVVPEIIEAAQSEGLAIKSSNQELVKWSDVVVVAVKPQVIGKVLRDMSDVWADNKLLVSICAGVTTDTYVRGLERSVTPKVVRVMPNTPCLVAEAASAYAGNKACQEWELDLVHDIFDAVGNATHRVPEYLLNTVTAVSGSGPAYVYMLINALSDAGVHGGLPRSVALSLATQTVLGSAKMVQQSGQHPMVLKEAVTSPAGTTIAAVRALENRGFNGAIIEAVETARVRAEELSEEPDFLFRSRSTGSHSPP